MYNFSVMRLGKKKEKEKENEPKSQVVDGVFRLICSPKTQNIPLKCKYFSKVSNCLLFVLFKMTFPRSQIAHITNFRQTFLFLI